VPESRGKRYGSVLFLRVFKLKVFKATSVILLVLCIGFDKIGSSPQTMISI